MKVLPKCFKPYMSKLDQFVTELPLDVVQAVILEANPVRRGEKLESDTIRELGERFSVQELGGPGRAGTLIYMGMEEACCRRLAYAMMGVSTGPAEVEETWYRGEAQDGSFWRIPRSAVINDMEAYEAGQDGFPQFQRPITDEIAEDWLFDNADTIAGWVLDSLTPPESVSITVLRGEEIKPSGGKGGKSSEFDFYSKLERAIVKAVPLGESRTVRDLARELKVSQKAIIEAVEGGMEGFDRIVAMGVRGSHNGYRTLPKGDQMVEHYE